MFNAGFLLIRPVPRPSYLPASLPETIVSARLRRRRSSDFFPAAA
jgi:hypothetical protein